MSAPGMKGCETALVRLLPMPLSSDAGAKATHIILPEQSQFPPTPNPVAHETFPAPEPQMGPTSGGSNGASGTPGILYRAFKAGLDRYSAAVGQFRKGANYPQ